MRRKDDRIERVERALLRDLNTAAHLRVPVATQILEEPAPPHPAEETLAEVESVLRDDDSAVSNFGLRVSNALDIIDRAKAPTPGPCPFCAPGHETRVGLHEDGAGLWTAWVECESGCRGPGVGPCSRRSAVKQAVFSWNAARARHA